MWLLVWQVSAGGFLLQAVRTPMRSPGVDWLVCGPGQLAHCGLGGVDDQGSPHLCALPDPE